MKTLKLIFVLCLSAGPLLADVFDDVKTYKDGESRKTVIAAESEVYASSASAASSETMTGRLIALLNDPKTTQPAKKIILHQWLPLVADASAVPVLAKLLDQPEVADLARSALERIPGDEAGAALRDALPKAKGKLLVGIINSLGVRRDAQSVALLEKLVGRHEAALGALGAIGSAEAVDALCAVQGKASEQLMDALLLAAQRRVQDGDPAGASRVYRRLLSPDTQKKFQLAALSGLIASGEKDAVDALAKAAAGKDSDLAAMAVQGLGKIESKESAIALVALMRTDNTAGRIQILNALSGQSDPGALKVVRAALTSSDPGVSEAAAESLGRMGGPDDLLPLLAAAVNGNKAALNGLLLLNAPGVDETIARNLKTRTLPGRVLLIDAAARRNHPGALSCGWDVLNDADPKVGKAGLNAISDLGGPEDYTRLIAALNGSIPAARVEDFEKAIGAVGRRLPGSKDRLAPLLAMLSKAQKPEVRESMIRLLGRTGDPEALDEVRKAMKNPGTRDAAFRALASWPDTSVVEDLVQWAEPKQDKKTRILALRGLMRLAQQISTPPDQQVKIAEQVERLADDPAMKDWAVKRKKIVLNQHAAGMALSHVSARSAERKKELAGQAPKGYRLAAYLDCGADTKDGAKPVLRQVSGGPWFWAGAEKHAMITAGSVSFADAKVAFAASGLDPKRSYKLGLTWWDYDGNDRVQSVYLSGKCVLPKVALPQYTGKKQPPKVHVMDVPPQAITKDRMTIEIRREGKSNAVVGELWLFESGSEPQKVTVRTPNPNPKAKRILLITGEDYKGHKWKLTAPALETVLEQDTRLNVEVVDDLKRLSALNLKDYAAVFMHFKNYDPKVPGRKAFDQLDAYVKNGGGLVLSHFACGAFQEFLEPFTALAGRAWNPKMRGHDPFGKFKVTIVDRDHASMKGLEDFEIVDELYTCLDGKTKIHVLATAVSKVDKKTYPMAFVLNVGKGRVFHSVLGHDVNAYETPGAAEIYRRGTLWAAGLIK